MKYDPFKYHRRSIRLKEYDYSQAGSYFVTIVTQNRLCLFGDIVNGAMELNAAGEMLCAEWEALPQRFPHIELDEFVVMPNHMHGIIVITDKTRARTRRAPTENHATIFVGATLVVAPNTPNKHDPVLGKIVGAWKSIVTNAYIRGVKEHGWQPFERKLWQRNYWEHIVRNEQELERIRAYIINNPANWNSDEENPHNCKGRIK